MGQEDKMTVLPLPGREARNKVRTGTTDDEEGVLLEPALKTCADSRWKRCGQIHRCRHLEWGRKSAAGGHLAS